MWEYRWIYVRAKYLCGDFLFSRKRTKIRKKTKYTILDNIDEQERMELRPKYGKSYLFLQAVQAEFNHQVHSQWF